MWRVLKVAILASALAGMASFHSSAQPLPSSVKSELIKGHYWHRGCPTPLSDLRLLKGQESGP